MCRADVALSLRVRNIAGMAVLSKLSEGNALLDHGAHFRIGLCGQVAHFAEIFKRFIKSVDKKITQNQAEQEQQERTCEY